MFKKLKISLFCCVFYCNFPKIFIFRSFWCLC